MGRWLWVCEYGYVSMGYVIMGMWLWVCDYGYVSMGMLENVITKQRISSLLLHNDWIYLHGRGE